MRHKVPQLGIAVCLLITQFFTACSKDNEEDLNNNGGTPSQTVAVSINNFTFTSATLTIAKGVKVTWTNNDSAPHTVTAKDNSFTSGNLNKGDSFSHTFTSAGTVDYYCKVHPDMTASVVVQ